MTDEIALVEPFLKGTAVALIKEGRLQDFFADFEDPSIKLVGATFIGEVDRFSKASNACFVKLPGNQWGFLRNCSNLNPGTKLILQSRLFSPKSKALVVSTNLSFRGRYVVITPKVKRVSFSRRIIGKDVREKLFLLAEKYQEIKEKKFGIIFRSICKESSYQKIKYDIEKQLTRCSEVSVIKPTELSIVEGAPNALEKARQEWHALESEEPISSPQCFDTYSVWEQVLAFRGNNVALRDGGNISIEPTQALVAIDVNTGSDLSISASLKANIQAIEEIPRQLRVRGLGGKIVLELGPLSKRNRTKIEFYLRKKTNSYNDQIKVVGWTPAGNLELERPRDRIQIGESELSQIEKNIRV